MTRLRSARPCQPAAGAPLGPIPESPQRQAFHWTSRCASHYACHRYSFTRTRTGAAKPSPNADHQRPKATIKTPKGLQLTEHLPHLCRLALACLAMAAWATNETMHVRRGLPTPGIGPPASVNKASPTAPNRFTSIPRVSQAVRPLFAK